MNSETIRRELRIAFSTKAQPVLFRILKWVVFAAIVRRYYTKPWFRTAVAAALTASIALHLFYRWKTGGWRRAWGGWDDVATGGG